MDYDRPDYSMRGQTGEIVPPEKYPGTVRPSNCMWS